MAYKLLQLIPFSGIQILDFELDLSTLSKKRTLFREDLIQSDNGEYKKLHILDKSDSENFIDDNNFFSEQYQKVVDLVKDIWFPAPFFSHYSRISGSDLFEFGPTTWARMRVKVNSRDDKNQPLKINIELALDTKIFMGDPKNMEDNPVMPSITDVTEERKFGFDANFEKIDENTESNVLNFIACFMKNDQGEDIRVDWVSKWIIQELTEKDPKIRSNNKAISKFITLVDIVGQANLPKLQFVNILSDHSKSKPISTDLVLDLGNSRTCGILLEKSTSSASVKLEDAFPLKIRNFSNPSHIQSGLIDSGIEFSQAEFGNNFLVAKSGNKNSFIWPGIVRVGNEAIEIQKKDTGAGLRSGLSSAKRYLWDMDKTSHDWSMKTTETGTPHILQECFKLLSDKGEFSKDGLEELNAEFRYPRSSLVMFMLAELICHAFVQINNPLERLKRPESELPRYLANIILTFPTATPSTEQFILRKRAEDALDLVWQLLNISKNKELSNYFKKPNLKIDWDEASCSQQVYLYNEIVHKFNGNLPQYLSSFGKKRSVKNENKDVLKIASIDIGGGTTDLMITSYFQEEKILYPLQEFREGFRLAGDDILERLIKRIILPKIIESLGSSGGNKVDMVIASYFQNKGGAISVQERHQKSLFTKRVLTPIALKILELFELDPSSDHYFKFSDIIEIKDNINLPLQSRIYINPTEKILDEFNKISKSANLEDWDYANLQFSISKNDFDTLIRDLLEPIVSNITKAVKYFQCDKVLLTGRPSKLEIIRTLFEEKFLVEPHNLISLDSYDIGPWYPFREAFTGKIGDPKSTVSVGALLNSVSDFSQLDFYTFKSNNLQLRSTAHFIGTLSKTGHISKDDVIIDNINEQNTDEFQLKFFQTVYLGSRQIDDEEWSTSPLYKIEADQEKLKKLFEKSREDHLPLLLTIRRSSESFDFKDENWTSLDTEYKKEYISIVDVEDKDGRQLNREIIKLKVNTLGPTENYWFETGIYL